MRQAKTAKSGLISAMHARFFLGVQAMCHYAERPPYAARRKPDLRFDAAR